MEGHDYLGHDYYRPWPSRIMAIQGHSYIAPYLLYRATCPYARRRTGDLLRPAHRRRRARSIAARDGLLQLHVPAVRRRALRRAAARIRRRWRWRAAAAGSDCAIQLWRYIVMALYSYGPMKVLRRAVRWRYIVMAL